jgi:hypothetical protein
MTWAISAISTYPADTSRTTPGAFFGSRWLQSKFAQYNLPKIIKRDRRYKDGRPHEAVETEAIKQTVLIEILRVWLEARLPEPLARVQERERRQRKRLAALLRAKRWLRFFTAISDGKQEESRSNEAVIEIRICVVSR